MSAWTVTFSRGMSVKENRSARSLQYRPERMIRCTWGAFSWSKSMSHSQLVSLVKYFLDGNSFTGPQIFYTVFGMLIAFLENNLQADGSVKIPAALRPYLGGMEVLVPKK